MREEASSQRKGLEGCRSQNGMCEMRTKHLKEGERWEGSKWGSKVERKRNS